MRTVGWIVTALLLLPAGQALAGRGGSTGKLKAAVASNSVDAIVAEVERAEKLACLSCIDVVAKLVDHPSAKVRDVAGWWLGKRGVRTEVIDTMKARLYAQDPEAARNAADVLGAMRDFATLPDLGAYLAKPLDETSGAAAARAIGNIGHPTGIALLDAGMRSPLAGVRAASLEAMRNLRAPLGQKAATGALPLMPALHDDDAKVRREAIYTMGHVRDAAAAGELARLVAEDPAPEVRKAAAWALGQIGAYAGLPNDARGALAAAQNDTDAQVRSVATGALGRLK